MQNIQQHTVLFLETISGIHSGLMLSWWHSAELTGMVNISAVFAFLILVTLPSKITVPLDTVHHSRTPVNISTQDILNGKIIRDRVLKFVIYIKI